MKAQWLTMVAVLIVGLGLGALLVGRPATPAHDVRITSVPSTTTQASTTLAPASTTSTTVTSATTTTSAATTTVRTVPSVPPTTTSTTSTTAVSIEPTSTVAVTTTTIPVPDRSKVSVLVVNAANISGIARAEARRLAALGYPTPVTDDATVLLGETTVYARAGHETEALVLLADAGLPADRLRPFPRQSLSTSDAQFNVILALGTDWRV